MGYILHMSDFHFGRNWAKEEERLIKLGKWINNEELQIKYLIFTGDMIDAAEIQKDCIELLKSDYPGIYDAIDISQDCSVILKAINALGTTYASAYNTILCERSIQTMEKAVAIFQQFINMIGVAAKDVVLCCGNHDRLRFAMGTTFSCLQSEYDESSFANSFSPYTTLCTLINNEISYKTTCYSRGNAQFIIANSNWKTPKTDESNDMCISCNVVSGQLETIRCSESFDRKHTFLVIHKPFDDICEPVKLPYQSDSILTVRQQIEQTVSCVFYGDKHTAVTEHYNGVQMYMAGKPLASDSIRYGLIDYNESDGVGGCNHLCFEKNAWKKIPTYEILKKIYDVSKPYLRSFAFRLLSSTDNPPQFWNRAIEMFQSAVSANKVSCLSKLYSTICTLKQDNDEIALNQDGIFEQIISIITGRGCKAQSLGIKGRPGVGKSTFSTAVYLQMLWKFYAGGTRYIPCYFNIEAVCEKIQKNDAYSNNVEEYINHCVSRFNSFLGACQEISENNHLPLCLFIDGLEKCNALGHQRLTIERQIYETLETELSKEKDNRYVMSFNTHDEYNFPNSFEQINRFSYVIFINRIRILPYKTKETKLDLFLHAYLSILGKPANNDAVETIKIQLTKFRSPAVDLSFFYHFSSHVLTVGRNERIWIVLKRHANDSKIRAEQLFGFRMDKARDTAGELYANRARYEDITDCGSERITITEYLDIINHPIVNGYLVASNYVEQLKHYSNTDDEIPGNSLLFSFVSHHTSIMIRLIIDDEKESMCDVLRLFISRHKKEIMKEGFLYSTLIYLCGHLKTERANQIVYAIPGASLDGMASQQRIFFAFCNQRSKELSLAVSKNITTADNTPNDAADMVIRQLISDENFRRFNRSYQLHYYEDESNNTFYPRMAWDYHTNPKDNFDFWHSFLILSTKLEPFLKSNTTYALLEFDLFTLCDLIYSRLQYKPSDSKSLFYAARYNEKNDSECEGILHTVVMLLNYYQLNQGRRRGLHDPIGSYFVLMKTRFSDALRKVCDNAGKDVEKAYVSPVFDFELVLRLNSFGRVGWNIPFPGDVNPERQPNYAINPATGQPFTPIIESIMEHTIESVYIALLFLPENIGVEKYNKYEVISMILFSEFGKVNHGDYSPNYREQHTLIEREKSDLSQMLILGALDGYALLPVFFKPFIDQAGEDINTRIALDIKLIQTEYKYYSKYSEIQFEDQRRREFETFFSRPLHDVCERIRNQLITRNPNFIKYFSRCDDGADI